MKKKEKIHFLVAFLVLVGVIATTAIVVLFPQSKEHEQQADGATTSASIGGWAGLKPGYEIDSEVELYLVRSDYKGMSAYNYRSDNDIAPFDQTLFYMMPGSNVVHLIEASGSITYDCTSFIRYIQNTFAGHLSELRTNIERYRVAGYNLQYYDKSNNTVLLFECKHSNVKMVLFNRNSESVIVLADVIQDLENHIVAAFGIFPYFEESKQVYMGEIAFLGLDENLLHTYTYRPGNLEIFGDFLVYVGRDSKKFAGVKYSTLVTENCHDQMVEIEGYIDEKIIDLKTSTSVGMGFEEFDVSYKDKNMLDNSIGLRCVSKSERQYLEFFLANWDVVSSSFWND